MNQQEPIVIEGVFDAPAEKIWNAITDKEQMKQWYFNLAEFKPETGFEFEFSGGTPEKNYLHLCKVTVVEKNKKLQYSWRYDGYEGISFVTFELFPSAAKTRLKLTHEGLETFPADNTDFAKGNFVAGWTEIIGTSLKDYLSK
jgi:uncharacterized protein YndB with AHSA1/START domain